MKNPTTISQADYLFMESTYGDRDHKDETKSREELAEAIRDAVTGSYSTGTSPVVLTASVGWTCGPPDDVDALLRNADAEMYRQKPNQRQRNS